MVTSKSTPSRSYADASEALIIGLARQGESGAFEELVRRRQSWVRNLMRRLSKDVALADDLAQQAFVQLWRTLPQLKELNAFAGWLKRLCINVWLQHIRRNDVLADSQTLYADEQSDSPSRQISSDSNTSTNTGLSMDLDAALTQLALPMRTCIVLNYQAGMSHREVGEALDMPLGTVKSNIKRGAQMLREILADYAMDEAASGDSL